MDKTDENPEELIGGDNQDFCVCCGKPVPEGRMICWDCEHQYDE